MRTRSRPGRVILVGAGPGHPDLLTLRGAAALRSADVVVYDALVGPELLDLAPGGAERVNVGKRGHDAPTRPQAEIEALLVERARAGKTVVRLKGGDPFVFGRGGEEASACAAAGVPFEVVPGVSAAIGVPAFAGIPVTDRRHAASFAVVTGHKDPRESATQVRWADLSRAVDTLVVLMGMRTLEGVVTELLAHGSDPATPAAAISDGTLPGQRVVEAPLAELPARVREAGLGPPGTLVVGPVVRLRRELAWWERLPLFGRRVLVTRAEEQASELVRRLHAEGAEAVVLPVIRVRPVDDTRPLDAALDRLADYDALLFTSANAVRFFAERAASRGVALAGPRVFCVGPATAQRAREAGLAVDLVPAGGTDAEGLLAALRRSLPLAGRRFLLPRAESAREVLPEGLRRSGARVEVLPIYRTEPAPIDAGALRARLAAGEIDALSFTSPSTVRHFLAALDGPARAAAARCAVVAIGAVTAEALRREGLAPSVVAERPGAEALVEALASYFAGEAAGGGR